MCWTSWFLSQGRPHLDRSATTPSLFFIRDVYSCCELFVTHCCCWLLRRELWCFWGWTSGPAGGWRSCLQHRRRRWTSPWDVGRKGTPWEYCLNTQNRAEGGRRWRLTRSYSPVESVEISSQSGASNHSKPKTQTQFGQSVCSLFRFRQVGDDHLRSCKDRKVCFWPGNQADFTQALTRYDVHEERGQFVNEQHGGMVGYGQQQEENHGGSARHAQSRTRAEQISKPAGKTQKTQSEHGFIYARGMKTETRVSPSKHGTPEELDQTHRGLQIPKPQGVEAQFLCQILENRTKGDLKSDE